MRKFLVSLLILIFWATPVFAAVSIGTPTSGTGNGVFTVNVTVDAGSGTNRLLVACVELQNPGTVTSITYNGVSMGSAYATTGSDGGAGPRKTLLFKLVAPSTGSNTLSVNLDDTWSHTVITALPLSGVDQTTPLGTAATAVGLTTNPSVSVSSASGELVIDCVHAESAIGAPTLTVDASQTQQVNNNTEVNAVCGISTEAGASSVSMDWTASTQQAWGQIGVSVKPASAAAAVPARHIFIQ